MIDNKHLAFPFSEISDEEWIYFSSKFTFKEYVKGAIATKEGEIEHKVIFLEEGVMRSFISCEDKDRTLRFAFPGEFISAYSSFILKTPSKTSIEALMNCKAWIISYHDLQDCYNRSMESNRLGRESAELLYITSLTREIDMLTKSPEQRYLDLLNYNPEWFQKIPLKYLASYLGITPQALSRIRKRIF